MDHVQKSVGQLGTNKQLIRAVDQLSVIGCTRFLAADRPCSKVNRTVYYQYTIDWVSWSIERLVVDPCMDALLNNS